MEENEKREKNLKNAIKRCNMITISLDEYGEFEKQENKPLFIAGVIFDDGEEEEKTIEDKIERERIRAYYKKVIASAGEGLSYPQDLHSNGDLKRDHDVIRLVKAKVQDTLAEFMNEGTYNGEPLCDDNGKKIRTRKGKYHLFVMLKSDDGKTSLLKKSANMLARDDWAANRYFHMASSVVNRIIFRNPLYKKGRVPSISIDIATRSTGNVKYMDSDLKDKFKKQSYKTAEIKNSDYQYYSIMNADIYRTLIAQEMVNTGNISINIKNLFVKSIKYDPDASMMEFLYLSDSLCSVLGYKLQGTSADGWLSQIVDRTKKLNWKTQNLVFGYDEIDNYFSKAWKYYEQGNLFEALSIVYDAKIQEGTFAEYYKNNWFPYLEKRICETVTPEIFNCSVNNLSAMLTTNNLEQEKLVYLMQQFEQMVVSVENKYRSVDMKSSVLYKLYDAGVSAFCHVGNAQTALTYYQKCKQYAFYVGVDAFLKTNNKLIVCLEDCFEWDKALAIADENVNNQQLVSELKGDILNQKENASLDEAKAISQLARIYAAKRDPKAEKYFRKALQIFEEGSANYKITQSYLLHFYADMNMQEAFDQEIQAYLDGNGSVNKRLKYILNSNVETHSLFSNAYALYVLIRGLVYFHSQKVDDKLWEKLVVLDETFIQKNGKKPSGHPWEIIYKYLEMLAFERNDDEAREKFARLKKESLKYRGEIITALELFGDAEVAEYTKDTQERDRITNQLVAYLQKHFDAIRNVHFSDDGNERYEELQQYFTFMYR